MTSIAPTNLYSLKYVNILCPKNPNNTRLSQTYTNIIYDGAGYNSYINFIIHMINGGLMCKGLLRSYIQESIALCDYLTIVMIFDNGPKVIGFSLFNIVNDMDIHIDVMCGAPSHTHVGTELINGIKEILNVMNLDKITLNAVFDKKGFYYKQGFKNNASKPPKENSKPMTYKVGGKRMRKTRKLQK